jgi:glucosyl-dolichyl phosphate glucuronosyltransferase
MEFETFDQSERGSVTPSFSVVICAYTTDRWQRLQEAVESVKAQDLPPKEIVVCVDHNQELLDACRELWRSESPFIRVIENRYPGRLGSARNSGLELVAGDVIAFLDDDARAEPDWLRRLADVYETSSATAVGGAPIPNFETARPRWFPPEFDWVFGCVYTALPQHRAPVRRLIGANMSVRRSAVLSVGGFHSNNHDDMDLSHRIRDSFGADSIVFDPSVRVSHYVTASRVTWAYFWRRCFHVNAGKVLAFKDMHEAGDQNADLAFVGAVLFGAVPRHLISRRGGYLRAAATVAGVFLAATGNAKGQIGLLLGHTPPALTRGIEQALPASVVPQT